MQHRQVSLEAFADEILPALADVEKDDLPGREIWRGVHPERGKIIVVYGGIVSAVDMISER